MFPDFIVFAVVAVLFLFFNDTAATEIYTLSLHDALPISRRWATGGGVSPAAAHSPGPGDRKSTRLNSSHLVISYAVFCLKKKKLLYYSFFSFFSFFFFFSFFSFFSFSFSFSFLFFFFFFF